MRIIHALNEPNSIKIIEAMQKSLIHVKHEHLIEYLVVAVDQEHPNIRFLVVEEYFSQSNISLRNLLDRVSTNNLLQQFFSEKTYLWRLIIQCLKGIAYLNSLGLQHGDINPNNICIIMDTPEEGILPSTFKVKLLDFLRIKELGEIAMSKVR